MAKNQAKKELPVFASPPVNETVFGISFARLAKFKAPYLGLLWSDYRTEFPKCDEAAPLFDSSVEDAVNWITPRVWFIHSDESRVIQVQQDRFVYNWRRREGNYPHFATVFPEFQKHFDVFRRFVGISELGELSLTGLELTYINHIPLAELDGRQLTARDILPDFTWRVDDGRFLPTPQVFRALVSVGFPDGRGGLNIGASTGRTSQDGKPILVLEMSARLRNPLDQSEISTWFEMAHEWIVLGFEDITGEEIQRKLWGKS